MPAKVKVRILAGRNLPVMDKSSDASDAFVEVKLGNTTYKTEVYRRSLNPFWNSEWFRFEVSDQELQDEPLQIRIMDYDTYSANDAIGKVYINLNPLLVNPGRSMNGWLPIYDTLHGIRGEINCMVKVNLFADTNRYRQSSCGVKFFFSDIPNGYKCDAILGFVDELLVNDDPEYQWIDKIRTPRASNEARQTLFTKLSGEVQRKLGLKAEIFGGNAVIGYKQSFDLEGGSGIVGRGIGTAVILSKNDQPFSALDYPYPLDINQAIMHRSASQFFQTNQAHSSKHLVHSISADQFSGPSIGVPGKKFTTAFEKSRLARYLLDSIASRDDDSNSSCSDSDDDYNQSQNRLGDNCSDASNKIVSNYDQPPSSNRSATKGSAKLKHKSFINAKLMKSWDSNEILNSSAYSKKNTTTTARDSSSLLQILRYSKQELSNKLAFSKSTYDYYKPNKLISILSSRKHSNPLHDLSKAPTMTTSDSIVAQRTRENIIDQTTVDESTSSVATSASQQKSSTSTTTSFQSPSLESTSSNLAPPSSGSVGTSSSNASTQPQKSRSKEKSMTVSSAADDALSTIEEKLDDADEHGTGSKLTAAGEHTKPRSRLSSASSPARSRQITRAEEIDLSGDVKSLVPTESTSTLNDTGNADETVVPSSATTEQQTGDSMPNSPAKLVSSNKTGDSLVSSSSPSTSAMTDETVKAATPADNTTTNQLNKATDNTCRKNKSSYDAQKSSSVRRSYTDISQPHKSNSTIDSGAQSATGTAPHPHYGGLTRSESAYVQTDRLRRPMEHQHHQKSPTNLLLESQVASADAAADFAQSVRVIKAQQNLLQNMIRQQNQQLVIDSMLKARQQTVYPNRIHQSEYPFGTLKRYPDNMIQCTGGVVSAHSVKLLDHIINDEESETRDIWWTEIRKEVRAHAKALNCNTILGYRETSRVLGDVCVLSACGTAAVLKSVASDEMRPFSPSSLPQQLRERSNSVIKDNHHPPSSASVANLYGGGGTNNQSQRAAATAQGSTNAATATGISAASNATTGGQPTLHHSASVPLRKESPIMDTTTATGKNSRQEQFDPNGTVPTNSGSAKDAAPANDNRLGSRLSSVSRKLDCSFCHTPLVCAETISTLSDCSICNMRKVPEVLLLTIEPPKNLNIASMCTLVQARVCRAKRDSHGEANAKEIGDALPFLEYEMHRQLFSKLKFKGMNCLFNLTIDISIGENMITAVATGTGCFVLGLPVPTAPQVSAGKGIKASKLTEIQRLITLSAVKNRDKLKLGLNNQLLAQYYETIEANQIKRRESFSQAAANLSGQTSDLNAPANIIPEADDIVGPLRYLDRQRASSSDDDDHLMAGILPDGSGKLRQASPHSLLSSSNHHHHQHSHNHYHHHHRHHHHHHHHHHYNKHAKSSHHHKNHRASRSPVDELVNLRGDENNIVLEVDDNEDADIIALLIDSDVPDGYLICSSESVPPIDPSSVGSINMFTQIMRVKMSGLDQFAQQFDWILQAIFVKLRRSLPCLLTNISFVVDLPEANVVQISVTGCLMSLKAAPDQLVQDAYKTLNGPSTSRSAQAQCETSNNNANGTKGVNGTTAGANSNYKGPKTSNYEQQMQSTTSMSPNSLSSSETNISSSSTSDSSSSSSENASNEGNNNTSAAAASSPPSSSSPKSLHGDMGQAQTTTNTTAPSGTKEPEGKTNLITKQFSKSNLASLLASRKSTMISKGEKKVSAVIEMDNMQTVGSTGAAADSGADRSSQGFVSSPVMSTRATIAQIKNELLRRSPSGPDSTKSFVRNNIARGRGLRAVFKKQQTFPGAKAVAISGQDDRLAEAIVFGSTIAPSSLQADNHFQQQQPSTSTGAAKRASQLLNKVTQPLKDLSSNFGTTTTTAITESDPNQVQSAPVTAGSRPINGGTSVAYTLNNNELVNQTVGTTTGNSGCIRQQLPSMPTTTVPSDGAGIVPPSAAPATGTGSPPMQHHDKTSGPLPHHQHHHVHHHHHHHRHKLQHQHQHTGAPLNLSIDITSLSYIPGAKSYHYLGNLSFSFVRETSSVRENGGLNGFIHCFLMEVYAIVRAHVSALGGNAILSFRLQQSCIFYHSNKNQAQCLISVAGDAVQVSM